MALLNNFFPIKKFSFNDNERKIYLHIGIFLTSKSYTIATCFCLNESGYNLVLSLKEYLNLLRFNSLSLFFIEENLDFEGKFAKNLKIKSIISNGKKFIKISRLIQYKSMELGSLPARNYLFSSILWLKFIENTSQIEAIILIMKKELIMFGKICDDYIAVYKMMFHRTNFLNIIEYIEKTIKNLCIKRRIVNTIFIKNMLDILYTPMGVNFLAKKIKN